MLALCESPRLAPTRTVRDIADNNAALTLALDQCMARMRCLVWWITTANHDQPIAQCTREIHD